MFKIDGKVIYKAFGLSLVSDISLPELYQIDNPVNSVDVEINILGLSNESLEMQNDLVINEDFVMFRVPDAATFTIQDGKRITVSPLKKNFDEDLIRLYILGSCMGVILMQKKIFPLHGSAVVINGRAYAFIGDSGVGKSTLASSFLSRGNHLLSDDVIAITFSRDNNIPIVTPSYPQQKLWQESLIEFGIETSQFRSIHGRENKFCIPVSTHFSDELVPLAGVFELVKTENAEIELSRIEKLERFHTLFRHTYRNFLISRLGLMDWHFTTSANILEKLDLYQLRRPDSGFSANQLVSKILNIINKGE